ncbi:MAG: hypothetical protein IT175_06220 [Acidobacteria bacterium]|nr:hypothetical protein [Acidobacteriota bacterium]
MSAPEVPQPATPLERLLVFGCIYGSAVLVLVVLLSIWGAMVLMGEGANYPDDMRKIVYGDLFFLFGGALAVKVTPH